MDDFNAQNKADLINRLENETKVFENKAIKKAFEQIDRVDFVDADYGIEAYEDYPLPIGFEQTISQPTTVAYMLELLDPQEGNSVLDIGSGSGWTTALLGSMVAKSGKVIGLERIPELVKKGQENIKKYQKEFSIQIQEARGVGIKGQTFDRILCSASIDENSDVLDQLTAQLKPFGVLVASVGESIIKITKDKDGKISCKEYPGFLFVPYVK